MTDIIDDEKRARNQYRIESAIDELPPLNDHIPDETPPRFEWVHQEPTEQERAEFYRKWGVKISRIHGPHFVPWDSKLTVQYAVARHTEDMTNPGGENMNVSTVGIGTQASSFVWFLTLLQAGSVHEVSTFNMSEDHVKKTST